jgi:hypothetical protein
VENRWAGRQFSKKPSGGSQLVETGKMWRAKPVVLHDEA